ncbi:MAG: hypothetical protein PWQ20_911 [Thermotogaceae bacterium]|nr:hypothetical protein [Thermotogaceae bacterium]MDN5337841.1 hypothetical protein [Thermotogaceae bacterium]
MKLSEIIEHLDLEVVTGKDFENIEVTGGYTCDLLSEVMANCNKGMAWITVQSHLNIVAVATICGAACIILANNHEYPSETIQKANDEGVILLKSSLNSYKLSGELYKLGIR